MSEGAGTNGFLLKLLGGLRRSADERVSYTDLPGETVKVRSSLDRTFALSANADERIVIGRDDVTVIKNHHESLTARFSITGEEMHVGRCVFRPSRQQSFVLWKGRTIELELGPGESCVIRSEYARNPQTSIFNDRANPMGM